MVAAQNNITVRLEAVEELLPSSIQVVPMHVQLVGLGIFSEVQQMYFTLEMHKLTIKVTPTQPGMSWLMVRPWETNNCSPRLHALS